MVQFPSSPSMAVPRSGSPDASRQAYFAARQKTNEDMLTYYAASLGGLIAIFILLHWFRLVATRSQLSRSSILIPFVAVTRFSRRVLIRKTPGFSSIGHAILVTVFVGLNAIFSFYRIDYSKPSEIASRFGWMATANMALVVFLALKNTPLAIFTAYSYERLNGLHQIAGYATLVYTIVHGATYAAYFIGSGRIYILHEEIVTAGIVLGFALFFTVLAGLALRRMKYEAFYAIHLALFVVIVTTMGLHRPDFNPDKGLIVTVLIGAMWLSDRLIRIGRLLYNSVNNEASVFVLPNRGIRLVLKKPLLRARPGKHCYVWLPKIRAFETHPFTIVSSDPMELIISTYSGFTRDLHSYAASNPGASLRVSLEGPYGTFPDPMGYDKVVLVAGGTGATFTFGLADSMLRRMNEDSKQQIEFIWAVRGHDNLSWFTQHIHSLRTHVHAPKIALKVHLTKLSAIIPIAHTLTSSPSQNTSVSPSIEIKSPLEKHIEFSDLNSSASIVGLQKDSEKDAIREATDDLECCSAIASSSNLPIIYGRPDTETLIKEAIRSVGKDQRVLVTACGPTNLLNIVRNTTAGCIRVDGPAVELHCEQFGW